MIKVGTRASQLALYQSNLVVGRLSTIVKNQNIETVKITTGGDKNRSVPISNVGGTGVFVKELEDALINETVDLVVHSLKDMPTDSPEGLEIVAVLDREDPADVLLSNEGLKLNELKPGSKLATSSRRRLAQIKAIRDDLKFVDIRGNVPTRIKKMQSGECDAIILAAAGLIRLELEEHIVQKFKNDECTPAAGQGALAIQCRKNDKDLVSILEKLDDPLVRKEITAERAFLKILGGGCSVPIGVNAKYNPDYDNLTVYACVAALNGNQIIKHKLSSDTEEPQKMGEKLADLMLNSPAKDILDELKASNPNAISPP